MWGTVVTGPYPNVLGRGLPTALPAVRCLALYEAAGEGFAVMSGCTHGVTPVQGKLLTRQGISLELLLVDR